MGLIFLRADPPLLPGPEASGVAKGQHMQLQLLRTWGRKEGVQLRARGLGMQNSRNPRTRHLNLVSQVVMKAYY